MGYKMDKNATWYKQKTSIFVSEIYVYKHK